MKLTRKGFLTSLFAAPLAAKQLPTKPIKSFRLPDPLSLVGKIPPRLGKNVYWSRPDYSALAPKSLEEYHSFMPISSINLSCTGPDCKWCNKKLKFNSKIK